MTENDTSRCPVCGGTLRHTVVHDFLYSGDSDIPVEQHAYVCLIDRRVWPALLTDPQRADFRWPLEGDWGETALALVEEEGEQ